MPKVQAQNANPRGLGVKLKLKRFLSLLMFDIGAGLEWLGLWLEEGRHCAAQEWTRSRNERHLLEERWKLYTTTKHETIHSP